MPAHVKQNYNGAHQRRRAALAPLVATGTIRCVFSYVGECLHDNPYIQPGQDWQLDHTHNGPAHARCNMSAGANVSNSTPRARPWT